MNETLKEELHELRNEVLNSTSKKESKEAKIIYDGRQYAIRFPKKFMEEAQINLKEDYFEIILEIPEYSTEEKPKLTATLIRKNEKNKTKV